MNLPAAIISNPPRKVPLSTRIVILLGGMSALFGWVIFGFGMIFNFIFIPSADLTSWYLFRGKTQTAPGIVTAVEQTKASEGGKHSSGTPVYAYSYHFNCNQTEYQGVSYHTGMAEQTNGIVNEKSTVTVEFLERNPDVSHIQLKLKHSRIENMRRNIFGPGVAFVLIFPLIGLAAIICSLVDGRKRLSLLVNGVFTQGAHTDKEATQTKIGGKTVYKVWFEYTDLKGELQKAFTKTTRQETIDGKGFEPLFYNSQKSSQIVALRDLASGTVTLDDRGQVSSCGIIAVLKALWPPLLGLAITATCFVIYHYVS